MPTPQAVGNSVPVGNTLTETITIGAGSAIGVFICRDSSATVTSVTDDLSTDYGSVLETPSDPGDGELGGAWAGVPASAGTRTVTVTFGSAPGDGTIQLVEVPGVNTSSPVRAHASNVQTSSTGGTNGVTCGPLTPTAGDTGVLFLTNTGALIADTFSPDTGGGYAELSDVGGTSGQLNSAVHANASLSAGSQSALATNAFNDPTVSIFVVFAAGSGSTDATVTPTGFAATPSLGSPSVLKSGVTAAVIGFALAAALGTPSVARVSNPTVHPTGIAAPMSLGTPSVQRTGNPVVMAGGFQISATLGVPFVTGSFRPGFGTPFTAASPWNVPVSARGQVATGPTSVFAGVTNPALGKWPSTLYTKLDVATANDPVVTLRYNTALYGNVRDGTWRRYGNGAAIDATILAGSDQLWGNQEYNSYSSATAGSRTPPASYHHRTSAPWSTTAYIPRGAWPPTDVDGHWAVKQPDGSVCEIYCPVVAANGDVFCHFVSFTDPAGVGDGAENGRRASMLPSYAGIVRDGEFTAGVIPHALALAVGPECLSTHAPIWPAVAMDDVTSAYAGPLPMGAWLTIPASVDLGTLGLATAQGMALAVAMQDYGGYITDQTGGGNFLILTQSNESDIPNYSFDLTSDIRAIMDASQVTTQFAGFNNPAILGTPTLVLTHSATVTPTGLSAGAALGTPSVVRVNNPTVLVSGFAITPALGTFTIQSDITLLATGLPITATLGVPSLGITAGATLHPTGFSATPVLGTPSLVRVSNPTVHPIGFAATPSLGTPTPIAGHDVTVAPVGISSPISLGTPSVTRSGVRVSPIGFGLTMQLGTPSLSGSSNPVFVASGFDAGVTLGSPVVALVNNPTVAPVGLAAGTTLGVPVVTLVNNPTVLVSGFALAPALGVPSVQRTGNPVVAPGGFDATMGLGVPTLSVSTNPTFAPAGFSLTPSLGTPSVHGTSNPVIMPVGFAVAASVGTPSIGGTNNPTVTPQGFPAAMTLGVPSILRASFDTDVPPGTTRFRPRRTETFFRLKGR